MIDPGAPGDGRRKPCTSEAITSPGIAPHMQMQRRIVDDACVHLRAAYENTARGSGAASLVLASPIRLACVRS
jgi:hypothetical protein